MTAAGQKEMLELLRAIWDTLEKMVDLQRQTVAILQIIERNQPNPEDVPR